MDDKTMSTEEFAEILHDRYFYDALIDELYWEQAPNKTNQMLDATLEEAKRQGITLTDANTWVGYDEYFYNMYDCTEKGLS